MKTPAPDNFLGLPELMPPAPWVSRLIPHRHKLQAIYVLLLVAYGAGIMVWGLGEKATGHLSADDKLFLEYLYLPILYFPVTIFMVLAQVFFFSAAPQLRWPRPTRKRSIWLAIVGGSAIAGALTAGVIMSLLSLLGFWKKWFEDCNDDLSSYSGHVYDTAIFLILGFWILWAIVFGVFWLGMWFDTFRRIYRLLIAGTILDLLISIPTQMMVEHRSTCACEEGSFFALAIGSALLLTGFGPGIFMLYMYRRMQLAEPGHYCQTCGYNLFGLASRRCPECGTDF